MPLTYSFAGKRVLVTGGASGIGRQLVQRFSEDGAIVFTVDKNAQLVEKLRNELPNVQAEIVDLADWKATRAVVESFGKLDHLVNNAGFLITQGFMDVTEEAAHLQYSVLVHAAINVTQVFAKGIIESGGGGSIVNISSVAAKKQLPGYAAYSAAKTAIVSLTKSMSLELGPYGIRANCICPGFVDTPLSRQAEAKASQGSGGATLTEKALDKMIIKRVINVNEIADLIMFLLSPLSAMMTGEEIGIDGGRCLT